MNIKMKIVFLFGILALQCVSINTSSPLKFLGKCISDHECEKTEFCDHIGINPIGECRIGYPDLAKCHFSRHCKSKKCHLFKCVAKKLVRDGPCNIKQHDECLPEQYCKHLKCQDRKCYGFCFWNDNQCLSGNCRWFLRCSAPPKNQLSANFCK